MKSEINFETIYNSYFSKIHNYLIRLIGPYHAEDVAQEVFDKVNKNLKSLKQESKLSTWLYRIATNTAIDKARTLSYKHLDKNKNDDDTKIVHDQNIWTGKKQSLIDQKLIKEQMRTCVQEFIDRLPEDYRTVLILKDYEDKSNKEIAKILDVSISTVKIRYHRSKQMLKKELDSGCDFFYDDENRLLCDRKQVSGISKKPPE